MLLFKYISKFKSVISVSMMGMVASAGWACQDGITCGDPTCSFKQKASGQGPSFEKRPLCNKSNASAKKLNGDVLLHISEFLDPQSWYDFILNCPNVRASVVDLFVPKSALASSRNS